MSNPNPPNQWKKGDPSPNPDGRPVVDETWAGWVRRIGAQQSKKDPVKIRKQTATESVFDQAERGNYKAWAALADREDGKAAQPVDLTSGGEKIAALDPRAAAIVADAEARLKEELLKPKP